MHLKHCFVTSMLPSLVYEEVCISANRAHALSLLRNRSCYTFLSYPSTKYRIVASKPAIWKPISTLNADHNVFGSFRGKISTYKPSSSMARSGSRNRGLRNRRLGTNVVRKYQRSRFVISHYSLAFTIQRDLLLLMVVSYAQLCSVVHIKCPALHCCCVRRIWKLKNAQN